MATEYISRNAAIETVFDYRLLPQLRRGYETRKGD